MSLPEREDTEEADEPDDRSCGPGRFIKRQCEHRQQWDKDTMAELGSGGFPVPVGSSVPTNTTNVSIK